MRSLRASAQREKASCSTRTRRRRPWLPVYAEDFDSSLLAKKAPNFQRRRSAYAVATRTNLQDAHRHGGRARQSEFRERRLPRVQRRSVPHPLYMRPLPWPRAPVDGTWPTAGWISGSSRRGHLRDEGNAAPGTAAPTSDLGPRTSDLGPRTSDLGPPTSDLRPPTSDLRPPTSDLRPPTSDPDLCAAARLARS